MNTNFPPTLEGILLKECHTPLLIKMSHRGPEPKKKMKSTGLWPRSIQVGIEYKHHT